MNKENNAVTYQDFKKSLTAVLLNVRTQKQLVHTMLVTACILEFKNEGQDSQESCKVVGRMLHSLAKVDTVMNVSGIWLWLEKVGGFVIETVVDDNENVRYSVTKNREEAKFSFDQKHLDSCKLMKNRYWKLAKPSKPLEIPLEEKVVAAFISQMMFINNVNDVTTTASGLADTLKQYSKGDTLAKSAKVAEQKTAQYMEQQKELAETAELAELLSET
jgi:hypothetical protein